MLERLTSHPLGGGRRCRTSGDAVVEPCQNGAADEGIDESVEKSQQTSDWTDGVAAIEPPDHRHFICDSFEGDEPPRECKETEAPEYAAGECKRFDVWKKESKVFQPLEKCSNLLQLNGRTGCL